MTAVASMGGVIASTEPRGIVTSAPFSDAFTRANGNPGQPWYSPQCNAPLQIVSDTLQHTTPDSGRVGLLLDSDDFDLTFDVSYAAPNGNSDDMQVAFRMPACWNVTDWYLFATNPDTLTGGTHGGTLYRVQPGPTFTVVHFEDHNDIFESTAYTFRLHVHGTTFDWYVNGALYYSTTMPSSGSGRAMQFVIVKPGTFVDNVSFV